MTAFQVMRALARFRGDRKGATAIEFGLLGVPFLATICAIFEVGYVQVQNEILCNAVANASREMLTGRIQTANITSSADFATKYLCQTGGGSLPSNFNCSSLIVDVRTTESFVQGDMSKTFYKSTSNQFCPGHPGQIVVVRVAYPLPAILPLSLFDRTIGVVNDVPNRPGNYHILMGAALFQEENYAGSYTSPNGC